MRDIEEKNTDKSTIFQSNILLQFLQQHNQGKGQTENLCAYDNERLVKYLTWFYYCKAEQINK